MTEKHENISVGEKVLPPCIQIELPNNVPSNVKPIVILPSIGCESVTVKATQYQSDMDKTEMTIAINVDFRIIFFNDDFRNEIVESLKEQFFEEQINIVESKLFGEALKYHYDAYVDEALIDKYGFKKVNEMVKEKIKERIEKEMEREFEFLKRYGG